MLWLETAVALEFSRDLLCAYLGAEVLQAELSARWVEAEHAVGLRRDEASALRYRSVSVRK